MLEKSKNQKKSKKNQSNKTQFKDKKSKSKAPSLWISEECNTYFKMGYAIKKNLFSKKSKFQTVDILETKGFGRVLLNDKIVMITERDERIYHEMIAHVPLFVHPLPKKVLIVGGGDGGTAREVLRHKEVQICDMVEIDALVIEACKKFIPQTSKALKDPRLNLYIEDALDFVKKTKKTYDVILIDSTDPIGPGKPLFDIPFYQDIKSILDENGIVVSQAESPFYEKDLQKKILEILNQCFSSVRLYNYSNLSYPGGLWSFSFASKKSIHPVKNFNQKKWKEKNLKLFYYNPEIHCGAFYLPEFMKKNYQGLLKNLKPLFNSKNPKKKLK